VGINFIPPFFFVIYAVDNGIITRHMIKKIFTQLLCVVFTFTAVLPARAAAPAVTADMNEQAIRAQYPDARIIHVAEEDYAQLAAHLSEQGYRVAANGVAPVEQDQQDQQESQKPERPEDDCGKRAEQGEASDDGTFRVIVDATDDILHSGNQGSSRESAAIVFVIVGAIVIVVWALYVIKYLYDSAVGISPCNRWSELTLVSSAISRSSSQHIDFNGVRFMTGFRTGVTDVGIAVELGRSDILLTEASALVVSWADVALAFLRGQESPLFPDEFHGWFHRPGRDRRDCQSQPGITIWYRRPYAYWIQLGCDEYPTEQRPGYHQRSGPVSLPVRDQCRFQFLVRGSAALSTLRICKPT